MIFTALKVELYEHPGKGKGQVEFAGSESSLGDSNVHGTGDCKEGSVPEYKSPLASLPETLGNLPLFHSSQFRNILEPELLPEKPEGNKWGTWGYHARRSSCILNNPKIDEVHLD